MSTFPSSPVRMLITNGATTSSNYSTQRRSLLETVELTVSTGIELVQIREKLLPARLIYELAVDAVRIASGLATKILINERFDIAIAAGADGVHLTSSSMPVGRVRGIVPRGFLIGVSAHSMGEVLAAKDSGADYAMLGPIFDTPGKGEPFGIEGLKEVCASVSSFPVIAVGGIDGSNVRSVLDAGAAGFAAIRYLNEFVKISQ